MRERISPFKAGLLTIVIIVVASYFGFTRTNPFANPFELKAVFENATSLKQNSPVRVAGVDVGKVSKVEGLDESGAAKVTMELKKAALPVHSDAEAKIRPRIFLEGNFFVDLRPGTSAKPEIEDGGTIPMERTSAPVQLGDVLRVLEADSREDLQTLLAEYSLEGLDKGGARAFNRAIPFFEPAYKSSSLVNDALLGLEPDRDLQRVLRGQQQVAEALTVDEGALKDLVTNLNITAGALAREDDSLRAAIPALRDTLRAGSPALASLDRSLPSLRAFAREALPGVRSSEGTIDDALPFIRQTRALMRRGELQGVAAELRRQIPRLVQLNEQLIPLLSQGRELSSCTNRVLVPFFESRIPSGEEGNSDQLVREQTNRSFVGLAGESRALDANGPWFRVQGIAPSALTAGEVQPAPPPDVRTPPQHRPDVPCETQDPPNLSAPGGSAATFTSARRDRAQERRLGERLQRLVKSDEFDRLVERARRTKP